MILASDEAGRLRQLEKLLPMQQRDFEDLFRQMSPLPVTVRLLDPPLHEFLPAIGKVNAKLDSARRAGKTNKIDQLESLSKRIEALTETNPMMGHRGCRLSITYPEILRMQVRAILQAAIVVFQEGLTSARDNGTAGGQRRGDELATSQDR